MRKLLSPSVLFLAVPMAVGVVWLLVSFFRFQPDDPRDFSTVKGRMLSADQHVVHHRRGPDLWTLEIRLEDSPVCYIVSIGYREHFRRQAFFAEVHTGDTIELTVPVSQIAKPSTGLLDSTPKAFVCGVRAGGRDYFTLEDYNATRERGKWGDLAVALVLSVVIVIIIFGDWSEPFRQPDRGPPPLPGAAGGADDKSLWNLLWIPLVVGGISSITIALTWLMWHVHTAIYPAHAGKFGGILEGGIGYWASISGTLLYMPLLFAAMPLGVILAKCVVWCVPPARRAFEREAQGVKWASFHDAMAGLWKLSLVMVPICLLLSLIGALTLTSLK
jgi:hypothetical protein